MRAHDVKAWQGWGERVRGEGASLQGCTQRCSASIFSRGTRSPEDTTFILLAYVLLPTCGFPFKWSKQRRGTG